MIGNIGTRTLVIGLTLVAMVCFFAGTSRADSITVTVDGKQYVISTVTGTFTDNMTQLESTPWWGDATLAQEFATAVGDELGTPNEVDDEETGGPLFAYNFDAVNAYLIIDGSTNPTNVSVSALDILSFSFGAAVTAPEPSSVALMLLGVGSVLVLRKRNSRGHQLAT